MEYIIRATHKRSGEFTHLCLMTTGAHKWRYGYGIVHTKSETDGMIKAQHATRMDLASAVYQFTMAIAKIEAAKDDTWLTEISIVAVSK